ncbi:hypothetical protein Tco_0145564 [Tanacetum coccineum]
MLDSPLCGLITLNISLHELNRCETTQGTNRESSVSVVRTIGKGVLKKRIALKVLEVVAQRLLLTKKKCKNLSETKDDDFNLDEDDSEGEVDEVGQYKVYIHDEKKQTPSFTPLSPPRTKSSQDDVSHYLNENP